MQALHLTKIEADSNGITENQSSVYFDMKLRSCVFALNVSSKASQLIRGLETTVKPVYFACLLFREFREPGKFVKITGHENLNTVAFQCSRKQKRQNYGVQNNYIDTNAKIKGLQYFAAAYLTDV